MQQPILMTKNDQTRAEYLGLSQQSIFPMRGDEAKNTAIYVCAYLMLLVLAGCMIGAAVVAAGI